MANRTPRTKSPRDDPRVQAIRQTGPLGGPIEVTFRIEPTPREDLEKLLASWATVIAVPFEFFSKQVPQDAEDWRIVRTMFFTDQEAKERRSQPLTQGQTAVKLGLSVRRVKKARERLARIASLIAGH